MENLSFLEELMRSDAEYWVVRRKHYKNPYDRSVLRKDPDTVYFIGVGYDDLGERLRSIDEMTIKELRAINDKQTRANIPLSGNYTPFQLGVSYSSFDAGFPVEKNINAFLELCRTSDKPDDWWGYQELYKRSQELEEAKQNAIKEETEE